MIKYYKLLQNIIWAKAWTIFEYWELDWQTHVWLYEWKSLWTIGDLIRAIWIDNKDFFDEIFIKKRFKVLKDFQELQAWEDIYLANSIIMNKWLELWIIE
jgi:hypothetical protein